MKFVTPKALAAFTLTFITYTLATAQLELPRQSPKASISYTVGLTEITIDYSAPAVRDRAGANEATTMTFSTDINVEGVELEAGTYSFFLIPRRGAETMWTAIFNKQSDQWGTYNYDQAYDAARIDVKPQFKSITQERLEFTIHDQEMDRGYIKMAWEKVRIYMRFKVDVLEQALANIDNALDEAEPDQQWVIYAQGANFLLENDIETRQAMEWADRSTSLHDHSWNWYIKARLQAKVGDYSGAVSSVEKSAEVGLSNEKDNFYKTAKAEIEENRMKWKKKAGL
jgi:hypothetical protein